MSIKLKQNSIIRGLHFANKALMSFFIKRRNFGICHDSVVITPPLHVGNYKNVFLGEGVSLGANAHITAINAKFICKGHCVIAKNLSVHTGNHARIIGQYVSAITEANKPTGYDKDIIVEEDVWIGTSVTLLAGVTIGRGVTVAAGAVVAKSIPPYCICGGVPAKVLKLYWTIDQIIEHEKILYPEEKRYTREQLEEVYSKYLPITHSS